MSEPVSHLYEFDRFRLDERERQLLRDGLPVTLTPKVFDLLLALVRHQGRLIEKEKLMREVWPDSFVEEVNLTVNISLLRRALGEDRNGQRFIETVPKRGYRFLPPVHLLWPEEDELLLVSRKTSADIIIKEEETEDEKPSALAKRGGRIARSPLKVLAACALLVALASALIYLFTSTRTQKAQTPAAVAPEIKSIAVLPFKPMIADSDGGQYLGMGITDSLINRLGHLQGIVVRPMDATLKYTDAAQDPLVAGRELSVDAVVDGRVQRANDHLWVNVQLIRGRDGVPLWSEKFDERLADIFEVQDSITSQVAQRLRSALTPQEKESLNRRQTESEAAYDAYTKGRYFWNKRTPEGYLKAYQYFQQAVNLDPKYAAAYAGIADCYLLGGAEIPTGKEHDASKVYALKALEIDDTLAEAHPSLAYTMSANDFDWQSADAEFRRAIELNPNYVTAHHWYAYHLVSLGRLDSALVEIKRALEIDPTSLIVNTDTGHILYFARRYDEAVAQYGKVLEMDPNFRVAHWRLGEVYERQGLYTQAIAELQKALVTGDDAVLTWLGHAYAVTGRKDEALKIITQLKSQSKADSTYYLALVYTGLGEKDEAFQWLQKSFELKNGAIAVIQSEPMLDGLRSDPRYRDLLRRMKLAL